MTLQFQKKTDPFLSADIKTEQGRSKNNLNSIGLPKYRDTISKQSEMFIFPKKTRSYDSKENVLSWCTEGPPCSFCHWLSEAKDQYSAFQKQLKWKTAQNMLKLSWKKYWNNKICLCWNWPDYFFVFVCLIIMSELLCT